MSDEEQRQVDEIEKDRRQREAALLAVLLLLIGGSAPLDGVTRRNRRSAARFAVDAYGMGHDPATALRQVIYGNPALHLPGVGGVVTNAMEEAWTSGYAKAFHLAGLEPPAASVPGVWMTEQAWQIVDGLYANVSGIVAQTIDEAKALSLTTPKVQQAIRDAIVRYGYSAREPGTVNPDSEGSAGYALAGVSTNAILKAWGGGYWDAHQQPAIAAKLWGYRHASILDDRTTDICIARDGLQFEKDNVYWASGNVPPLHWNCRSLLWPLYGDEHEESEDYPEVPVAPGWGFNVVPT